MNLYINNFILRESCYDCPAKGLEKNVADIILGDYWGIYHVHREMFDNLGVSAVIIKTSKGKELYDKIKNQFIEKETHIQNITKYNPSLIESVKRPLERSKIFNDIENNELKILSKLCNYKIKTKNEDKNKQLASKNKELTDKLNQIYNSKRFKLIDKLGNIWNKILHK